MAAPQVEAGALERVETLTNCASSERRHPRPRRALMGVFAEGLLAHRGLSGRSNALPNAYWHEPGPERIPRPLPRFPGMLSEPPGADPHAGWCGGRRGEPGAYPMGGVRPA